MDSEAEATTAPAPPAHVPLDPERLSFVLIALAAARMIAVSWQKWADPLIDFGTELYIPWRLSEGDLLYRDIAHIYAPLSSYVNLGWFSLLGVSLRSLVIGNAILLAVFLFLFYRLLRRMTSVAVATAAILLVELVFAFSTYGQIGNYNFLTPYAHELTHGMVLSLVALTALTRYRETQNRRTLIGCALALGLVFLTKPEVFAAAAGAVALGLFMAWRTNALPVKDLQAFLAALPVPFLACWALLATYLPATGALRAALGPYPLFFNHEVTANPFYLRISGLDDPLTALAGITSWAAFYVLATLPVAFLGTGGLRLDDRVYAVGAVLLPLVGLSLPFLEWSQALFPLPLFLLLSIVALVRSRARPGVGADPEQDLRLTLTVFALLLLAKIAFAPRVTHYGFALAVPGAALLVVIALDVAPAWLDLRGLNGRFSRIAAVSLLVAFAWAHAGFSSRVLAQRTYSLGEGGDTLRTDKRGAVIARAVNLAREQVGPDQTLLVLPEGVMVNYLARRRSSVSYNSFEPVKLAMFPEDAIVRQLRAHPPDYVLVFSGAMRSLEEFGCRIFGDDCARDIGTWLRKGYSRQGVGEAEGRTVFTFFEPKKAAAAPPEAEAQGGSTPK